MCEAIDFSSDKQNKLGKMDSSPSGCWTNAVMIEITKKHSHENRRMVRLISLPARVVSVSSTLE